MRKQSKSSRIAKYITENPDAKPSEVAKKFKCHPSQVYAIRKGLTKPLNKHQDDVNSHQEGGDHYKTMAIQPWDFIVTNKLGFLEGNIVKYVCRWQSKGGIEDLKKASHYLAKLIAVAGGKNVI